MEEAVELGEYLPQSFAAAHEQAYLDFLWSAFQTNYEAERYEFASLAFHLLYMSFISFSVWQIRLARPTQFQMAMVGFRNEDEKGLMDCESPFKFYDALKESQIFRFLKLIGCTNHQVGEFAKFVRRRNRIAHPTGSVFFNDRAAFDKEVTEMMREVRKIEAHMKPVILELYQCFLRDSADPEERQYSDPVDEVTANLIHANYMSAYDLHYCLDFNIEEPEELAGLEDVSVLHEALRRIASETNATEAAE